MLNNLAGGESINKCICQCKLKLSMFEKTVVIKFSTITFIEFVYISNAEKIAKTDANYVISRFFYKKITMAITFEAMNFFIIKVKLGALGQAHFRYKRCSLKLMNLFSIHSFEYILLFNHREKLFNIFVIKYHIMYLLCAFFPVT